MTQTNQTPKTDLEHQLSSELSLAVYYAGDALQSNLRVLSLLTDYTGLIPTLGRLESAITSDNTSKAKELTQGINRQLLQILTQATYTGRCLGGIVAPNAGKDQDQRQFADDLLKQAIEIVAKNNVIIFQETDKKH